MKRLPSSDSMALGCYAYAAIAVLLSLTAGADFPFSVDWTIATLASLWERQPLVVSLVLFITGGFLGYRYRNGEGQTAERFRDQLDYLWEENFTGEEVAELQLRLALAGSERESAKETIYARLRGETVRPKVFNIS